MLTLLSILFLAMIAKLLFVLLSVKRFAMQRIYVDRINWCGMVSGNKQRAWTCLYQEEENLLLINCKAVILL